MIIERIGEYYDKTIRGLIDSYDQKGLRASGKYARELQSVITSSGTNINAKITGPPESYYMEHGRGPNRVQNLQAVRSMGWHLQKWVQDKGIQVNPYAAAHKIVYEGIRVPNPFNPGGVISDVINDNWFKELFKILRSEIVTYIKSDVLKQLKS